MPETPQVAALRAERARHVAADRPERVAQIDAELAALETAAPRRLETTAAPRATRK
jgi:hypothetical protein